MTNRGILYNLNNMIRVNKTDMDEKPLNVIKINDTDNNVVYFRVKEKISFVQLSEKIFFVGDDDIIYDVPWFSDEINNMFVWKQTQIGDSIKQTIIKGSNGAIFKTYENMTRIIKPENRKLGDGGILE
jgi:hypothetical protein